MTYDDLKNALHQIGFPITDTVTYIDGEVLLSSVQQLLPIVYLNKLRNRKTSVLFETNCFIMTEINGALVLSLKNTTIPPHYILKDLLSSKGELQDQFILLKSCWKESTSPFAGIQYINNVYAYNNLILTRSINDFLARNEINAYYNNGALTYESEAPTLLLYEVFPVNYLRLDIPLGIACRGYGVSALSEYRFHCTFKFSKLYDTSMQPWSPRATEVLHNLHRLWIAMIDNNKMDFVDTLHSIAAHIIMATNQTADSFISTLLVNEWSNIDYVNEHAYNISKVRPDIFYSLSYHILSLFPRLEYTYIFDGLTVTSTPRNSILVVDNDTDIVYKMLQPQLLSAEEKANHEVIPILQQHLVKGANNNEDNESTDNESSRDSNETVESVEDGGECSTE